MSPCICDGMSLAIRVRDLLALYEDPAQQVTALDPPDVMELLKSEISMIQGLITRFFVSLANLKWIKNPYFLGRRSMPLCTRGIGMAGSPALEYFGFLEKVHEGVME